MAAALLLLSCGERTQTTEPDCVNQQSTELRVESAPVDSTEIQSQESTSPQRDISSPAPSSSSSNSSGSYDEDEEEEDGMRHFDPASEDDMDDNGMSRYMDSNDEEGWE